MLHCRYTFICLQRFFFFLQVDNRLKSPGNYQCAQLSVCRGHHMIAIAVFKRGRAVMESSWAHWRPLLTFINHVMSFYYAVMLISQQGKDLLCMCFFQCSISWQSTKKGSSDCWNLLSCLGASFFKWNDTFWLVLKLCKSADKMFFSFPNWCSNLCPTLRDLVTPSGKTFQCSHWQH